MGENDGEHFDCVWNLKQDEIKRSMYHDEHLLESNCNLMQGNALVAISHQ